MQRAAVVEKVQSILVEHFDFPAENFDWSAPLRLTYPSFILLRNLQQLEEQLSIAFGKNLDITHHISVADATPSDLVEVIITQLTL
ncbi:MAG: hypothetical protein AAF806_10735 [Bacteroidota bacterium]